MHNAVLQIDVYNISYRCICQKHIVTSILYWICRLLWIICKSDKDTNRSLEVDCTDRISVVRFSKIFGQDLLVRIAILSYRFQLLLITFQAEGVTSYLCVLVWSSPKHKHVNIPCKCLCMRIRWGLDGASYFQNGWGCGGGRVTTGLWPQTQTNKAQKC